MKKLSIEPIKNGPLKVVNQTKEDLKDILFYDSQPLILAKTNLLCRCGRTNNQPYCDGTHIKYNFTSRNNLEEEILQIYDSKNVTVTFNRSICAGSENCVKKFPDIYTSGSVDWINLEKGTIENIIASIEDCPSGALSYSLNKDADCQLEDCQKEKIDIIKHGPIQVRGPINIKIEKWSSFANKTKFTLCRCGNSQNKPFCDYSHASIKDDSYTF
ncbi:MAG: CDGSH iron-sulfur domain-containing protein [Arcobacter sp.]|uniref:CDGSH iron-sulfur domain-containing protein n=1 Tax=Arcobacter sp. TaxID=1872629 RepID=UPI003B005EDC